MTDRTCLDCPKVISEKSKGRCRACANRVAARDPVRREAQRRGINAFFAIPVNRAVRAAALSAANKLPSKRERLRQICTDPTSERYRRWQEASAKGREISRIKKITYSWCDTQWLWLNEELRRKRIPLADRKRIIAQEMEKAERARLAALTKHERDLERLRNGARLVERPVMRVVEHAFSLTGSSAALL